MYTHRHIRPYIGKHVQCHTHFGTFQGVIVHCTKQHVILMPASGAGTQGMDGAMGMPGGMGMPGMMPDGMMGMPEMGMPGGMMGMAAGRPFGWGGGPMGPGPGGPGGPVGPGGGPMGGPGGGWNLAIPLAAILGITAVGMHWW